MTELDAVSEADAFIPTIKRLHRDFPTKNLAQTKGFHEIRKLGDELYLQVLNALGSYKKDEFSVAPFMEFYELLEHVFWYVLWLYYRFQ
jgi:hypothetical protein